MTGASSGYSPGWKGVALDYWTTPCMLCFAAVTSHGDHGICISAAKMCAGLRECHKYVVAMANGGGCLGTSCNCHFNGGSINQHGWHFNFHSSIDDFEFSSYCLSGIGCCCSAGCGCLTCWGPGHNVEMNLGIGGGIIANTLDIVTVTFNSGTYYACPTKICLDPTTKQLKPCCILRGAPRTLRAGNISCNVNMYAKPYTDYSLCFLTYGGPRDGIEPTAHQACYVETGNTIDINYGPSYAIDTSPISRNVKRYEKTADGRDIIATLNGSTGRCITSVTFNLACR
jgi:hypothetical protein